MSNSTKTQKDAVINLYKSLRPDSQTHKYRLSFQVIDNNHDSANGTFTLGEITLNSNGIFSEAGNLLFENKDLASFTSNVVKELHRLIDYEFTEIAKSDKSAKRAQLELQKAAIDAQLKEL